MEKFYLYRVDCNGVTVAPIDGRDAVITDAGLRHLRRTEMDALYECETAAAFCEAVNRHMDYDGNRYFADYAAAENYRAARADAAEAD